MKTMKFWLVMVAAIVLAGMTCTSCSSDELTEPSVPEVVESEVLGSGCNNDVVENSGTQGTSLSYESWIYVRQKTRAISENKISVTLTNRFNNVEKEAEVADFEFGTPKVEISYRLAENRTEQNFVTISDSVLVYRLTYANGFNLEYELMFETPEYNDGATKQQMPYHKIEKITENGLNLTALDDQIINGKKWFCKRLSHSITVAFNNRNYNVAASVIIRCPEPDEDVLLSSKKVGEGLELVSVDQMEYSGVFRSWVEIEQQWSVSGKKTVKKEILLNHSVIFPNTVPMERVDNKFSDWKNFKIEKFMNDPVAEYGEYADNVAVNNFEQGISIKVTKSDVPDFRTDRYISYLENRATYKDEKFSCDFPYPEVSIEISFVNVDDWQLRKYEGSDDTYYIAQCRFDYIVNYGNKVKHTASSDIFFVYE